MLYSIFSTLSPSIFPRFISFEIHTHTHTHTFLLFPFSNSIVRFILFQISQISILFPPPSHFLILLFDLPSLLPYQALYKYEFMGERGAGGVALMYG